MWCCAWGKRLFLCRVVGSYLQGAEGVTLRNKHTSTRTNGEQKSKPFQYRRNRLRVNHLSWDCGHVCLLRSLGCSANKKGGTRTMTYTGDAQEGAQYIGNKTRR